jgi:ribosomal protein S18 acetylase RimI-like enzyme
MTSFDGSPATPRNVARSLRSLHPADIGPLEAILRANRPLFSEAECRVAGEVLREAVAGAADEDPYQVVVAEEGGRAAGFACFGSVPLADGAFDLYWIAVDPACHGRGVGAELVEHVERAVAAQGGRLVVVETSGRSDYDRTRRFYERLDFEVAARIRDFYRPGDDKVVYVKSLGSR